MNTISEYPSFNPSYTDLDLPKTLDITVLDLLVRHELNHPQAFPGLSIRNILRKLNGYAARGGVRQFTRKEIGEVRRALLILEKRGLVGRIKRSRLRWQPTTRAITAHGFAEGSQTPITRWL